MIFLLKTPLPKQQVDNKIKLKCSCIKSLQHKFQLKLIFAFSVTKQLHCI